MVTNKTDNIQFGNGNDVVDYLQAENDKLQAENERLRELPSLHDVMDIVRPNGAGKEIPLMVRQVYETIKKLGNFA